MSGTTKDRRRVKRARNGKRSGHLAQTREYNYVLQISEDERRILASYHQVLAQGTARFAQVYYNYLFDNPATADVLYAYERAGGHIGDLVRSHLAHLVDLLRGPADEAWSERLDRIGEHHQEQGVRPVWMLGGYRLFLNHLLELIAADPGISLPDRDRLNAILVKLVLRDFGMASEAYWQYGADKLQDERNELQDYRERVEDLLECIPQQLWSVDVSDNNLLYLGPGLEQCLRGEVSAPIPCLSRILPEDQETVLSAWQHALQGEVVEVEVRQQLDGMKPHWYRFQFSPVTNRRGRVLRIHALMEDIDAVHVARQRLQQRSTTDDTTGLANRALWYDRLGTALAHCRRHPGSRLAVMVLDINQFKMYNDTLGYTVGDDLLSQLAGRLQGLVRDTDTLARLDGDDFGIILPMVQGASQAVDRVAREVLACFEHPFSLQDRELCLSGALGIALYPEHGEDAYSLLSHADSALHRAKRSGEPYQFYETTTHTSPGEQLQFSGQLHNALERGEFELHYQPQIDIGSSRICGAEALLRWQHPQEGLVLPRRFIPLAEQLGMITPITHWVLVTALQQCKRWRSEGIHMPVAINVSARSFQRAGLVEKVRSALEEAQVDGACLEIEITEETLMEDLGRGAEVLRDLHGLGVGVAIDDFGTGYSSLAYLRHLPIHTLKIDRTFLSGMASSEQDLAIVRSIIDLGHNLGCKVVAEGVEDAAAWGLLETLGCDAGQGYHISRPLSQQGFTHWLSDTAWTM
jgi:diguanylate cyclase (GGDEF)-like protein